MEVEMKQPTTNTPTTATLPGMMDKPKFTVESTPPAAFTEAENLVSLMSVA